MAKRSRRFKHSRSSRQEVTITNSKVKNITQIVRFGIPTMITISVLLMAIVIASGYDLKALLENQNIFVIKPTPVPGDQVLVLLAEFNDESESVNYDVTSSIEDMLREGFTQHNLDNVRLERIDQTFKRNQLELVKSLGEQYGATIVIWGYYDDGGMFPRFTILQRNRLERFPESPQDKLVNLVNPPEDFSLYVHYTLPTQMRYFAEFTIGQIAFFEDIDRNNALELLEGAAKSSEIFENEALQNSLPNLYTLIGVIYGEKEDYTQAIRNYNKAIEFDPNFALAYNNRSGAYLGLGDLDQAISDIDKAIELYPRFPEAHLNRGSIYMYQASIEIEKATAYLNYANSHLEFYNSDELTNYGLMDSKFGDQSLSEIQEKTEILTQVVDETKLKLNQVNIYFGHASDHFEQYLEYAPSNHPSREWVKNVVNILSHQSTMTEQKDSDEGL